MAEQRTSGAAVTSGGGSGGGSSGGDVRLSVIAAGRNSRTSSSERTSLGGAPVDGAAPVAVDVPSSTGRPPSLLDRRVKKNKPARNKRTDTGGNASRLTADVRSVLSSSMKSSLKYNPMLEEDVADIPMNPLMPKDMAPADVELKDMYNMATGMTMHPVELQRRAVVKFQFFFFILETLIHNFQFIFVPLFYLIFGRVFLVNHQFIHPATLITQILVLGTYVTANVVWFVVRPANVSVYEVVVLNALWIVRNLVVASKWAYMSPIELEEMWIKDVSFEELRNKQIISGWTVPSRQVLEEQLLLASVRQKMDLKKYVFECTTEDNVPDSTEPAKRHTAWTVGLQLVTDAVREYEHAPVLLIALIFSVVHSLIPIFARAIRHEPVFGGESYAEWAPYVFWFCSAFSGSFLFFSNISFTMVGLVDFKRRVYCAHKLNHIISHSLVQSLNKINKLSRFRQEDVSLDDMVTSSIHIDLSQPSSTAGWYALRQVLRDFGLVYYRRINIYASFFAVYTLGLVLNIILALIVPQVITLDGTLVLFVIFDVSILMVAIFLLVIAGSESNYLHRSHAFHCSSKQFDILNVLHKGIHDLPAARVQEMKTAATVLSTVVDSIYSDNLLNNVTILGFEASGQFAGTFAAVAGTGIVAAARGVSEAFL